MTVRIILLIVIGVIGWVFLLRHEIVDALRFRPSPPPPSEAADRAALTAAPVLQAELAALGLKLGNPVFVRIFKESRELELWLESQPGGPWIFYKTYPLCGNPPEPGPGSGPSGKGAPEGFYFATSRQLVVQGGELAIDIGFPNAYDRQHRHTGKTSRIEGGCQTRSSYPAGDAGIAEIVTLVRAALGNGQPFFRIHCFPFRMTDDRMNRELAARATWIEFWGNMKEGYDYFDVVRRPPNTTLKDGNYVFE